MKASGKTFSGDSQSEVCGVSRREEHSPFTPSPFHPGHSTHTTSTTPRPVVPFRWSSPFIHPFKVGLNNHQFNRWLPADGKVFSGAFALDTETCQISDVRPDIVPAVVLGAAYDGRRGCFIHGEDLPAFLAAHPANPLIFHNAAFDLAVLQTACERAGQPLDIYGRVEKRGLVADTLILARLVSHATMGHTARAQCSLGYCSEKFLGLKLPKDATAESGEVVRTGFDQFHGLPFEAITAEYLTYAGSDPVATWLLFEKLKGLLLPIKRAAPDAFGYAGPQWLDAAWKQHGPLSHDVQLRASIVMDRISRTGVLVDQSRRDEKIRVLQRTVVESRHALASGGIPVDGKGSQAALRKRIQRLMNRERNIPVAYTETGQIATDEDQLSGLACFDPLLAEVLNYRRASKLLETYLKKMSGRLHARFNFLMNTGRTSCSGGFNLQNLPKERDATEKHETTVRGCFVPAPGKVFVVVDYAQIELAVLGWAWKHQLGFGDSLHTIVTESRDMHRLIAAKVLDKAPEHVTSQERNAAKPVSLGRPGGLGAETIKKIAHAEYGVMLTDAEVEQRIRAYESLCPELVEHLKPRVDVGLELARQLGLTPLDFSVAIGRPRVAVKPDDHEPAAWLGHMLLKCLESRLPVTSKQREYTPAELDYFWSAARKLPLDELDEESATAIRDRRPSPRLRQRVRGIFSREPIITATGRLRAKASFNACRNGIMQGLAADGAIYALWELMRAGYTIVNFIHDEVICEVPEDEHLPAKIAEIERLMIAGMQTVVPGANVRVETTVRRSFSKADTIVAKTS